VAHHEGLGQGAPPWLEHRADDDEPPIRIALDRIPFRIGRSLESDFVIHSTKVSKEHAEILRHDETWLVRDIGSRNGTFVNGERIEGSHPLDHGDVIHVAAKSFTFRLRGIQPGRQDATLMGTSSGDELVAVRDLLRAIHDRAFYPVFQPIVDLSDRALRGYECLGRCEGARSIIELFHTAAGQGRASDLSRLLRELQIEQVAALPPEGARIFMNAHPAELADGSLLDGLGGLAETLGPQRAPVIEIHENSITDLAAMARLRSALRERGLEIAYDDFGAGQSRLMELAEVPPDFIKLDLSIVRDIDKSPARRDLVAALVGVMRDRGIQVLAEGIETEGELEVCRAVGCELGQGYLFGRPERRPG
jgi:EAL domain-containing protein (putative c-di-GMP-specific phosphodiesterase class I)